MARKSSSCPDAGDVIWLDFDPTVGREITKRHPALVLTAHAYNRKAGLCVVCALTSSRKGYPFEVGIDGDMVLADQIRSLSWEACRAEFIRKAPAPVIAEVRAKLRALLGLES